MPLEDVRKRIEHLSPAETLIVCMGNDLKADDAAGPLLYGALHGRITVPLLNTATVPENYIRTIIRKSPRTLIVVDAVDFNSPAGTIALFESADIKSPTTSTHVLSPSTFVDMIAAEIPIEAFFIAIQPGSTRLGHPAGPEVVNAIQSLANLLCEIFPVSTTPAD